MENNLNKLRKFTNNFCKRKSVRKILGEDYKLSELELMRLERVYIEHKNISFCDWANTIAYMIKNNTSNYSGRLRRLRAMNASPNKYAYILRYGRNWQKFYSECANKRTKNFKNKVDYWLDNGFSLSEAKNKVSEIQKSRSLLSPVTQRGTSEYSCRTKVFWMNRGLTEEQAKVEVRRVSFAPHTPERIRKWQETLNNKSSEEKELINLKKGHTAKSYEARGISSEEAIILSQEFFAKRKNYSKISQKFFDMINDKCDNNNFYYKIKNYEKQFNNCNADFYDPKSQVVIEFYGNFWHRNPQMYKKDFVSYNQSSEEIWQRDKSREEKIKNHPQVKKMIIVWEDDFRKNPQGTVDKILKELI